MSKHFSEDKETPAYYLSTYKLKGHTTWRAHLSGSKDGFENEQKVWQKSPNPPTITDLKVFRLDRLHGKIKEI